MRRSVVSNEKRSASLLYSSPLYRNGHAKDSLRCRISPRKKVRIQSVRKSCLESMRSSFIGGIRMDGPIITVDVSKGNCHYQPFLEKGKPLRKPKILYDTIEGFEELQKSIDLTRQKSEKEVSVVFGGSRGVSQVLAEDIWRSAIPYYHLAPYCPRKAPQDESSRQQDRHP